TVAPLVRAWGFGADAADEAPDNDALAALRERVGVRHLTLDREAATLSKDRADVTIDLSAVAKGHGVDRAAAAVRAAGYTRFLVEVGGEVVVAGTGPGRRHWRLGIERPDAPPGTVREVVPMRDRALATSGDYRNVRKLGEKRISHTIDPRTGRPVEHALASVSVLADDCRTADGLATALSVLGPEDGMRLCREQKLAAYFLVRREDGSFDGRACPAWQPTIDAMQQDR
ncbi:MAG: Thiamine biosynthesis lipoprotein ApbE precursor, partial [Pseudomonadota bacterium]